MAQDLDDDDHIENDDFRNFCADLVTYQRTEPFLRRLFRVNPGVWVLVRQVCTDMGLAAPEQWPHTVATWLPDPPGDQGYAVVLFYDPKTLLSFTAVYNLDRLLRAAE